MMLTTVSSYPSLMRITRSLLLLTLVRFPSVLWIELSPIHSALAHLHHYSNSIIEKVVQYLSQHFSRQMHSFRHGIFFLFLAWLTGSLHLLLILMLPAVPSVHAVIRLHLQIDCTDVICCSITSICGWDNCYAGVAVQVNVWTFLVLLCEINSRYCRVSEDGKEVFV